MEKVNEEVRKKERYLLSIGPYTLEQIEGIERMANIIINNPLELVEETIKQWGNKFIELEIELEVMNLFCTKYDLYDVNKLFKGGN